MIGLTKHMGVAKVDKVYLVEAGWYYEGASTVHIASTKELAETWRDKNYILRSRAADEPGDDKQWFNRINKDDWLSYDYINITEMEVDSDETILET